VFCFSVPIFSGGTDSQGRNFFAKFRIHNGAVSGPDHVDKLRHLMEGMGPENQIHVWCLCKHVPTPVLGQTTAYTDDHLGVLVFPPPVAPKLTDYLLGDFRADAACIYQDDLRLAYIRGLLIACLGHDVCQLLGIMDVHLAPKGVDKEPSVSKIFPAHESDTRCSKIRKKIDYYKGSSESTVFYLLAVFIRRPTHSCKTMPATMNSSPKKEAARTASPPMKCMNTSDINGDR